MKRIKEILLTKTILVIMCIFFVLFGYVIPKVGCDDGIERINSGSYRYDGQNYKTRSAAMSYCMHDRSFLF
jgi:hypothetical protein